MPGNGARGGADLRRAAAVVLLVAVAAVGLRAGGAFSAAGSPEILGMSGRAVYWILAFGEVLLALAGIALLIARMIWGRGGGKAGPRKRRSIWWLLVLPFAVLGLSRVLQRLRGHATAPPPAGRAATGAAGHAAGHHSPGSPWPVLVLFVVVALVSATLAIYRRRGQALPPLEPGAGEDAEPLAAALAAGARALHEDPDPRTAIIGCYAAMERSLADAGLPPRMADTPAEVLSRATAGGLVRSAPASALTGLFRRARYSSHPVTEVDRAAAVEALAQVQADLADGPMAQAGAGGET